MGEGGGNFRFRTFVHRDTSQSYFKALKPKLVQILFKNLVRTAKKTHLTITKMNWLTLFREIIAVYTENNAKRIITKCSIADC
jgi:hypothetical protein